LEDYAALLLILHFLILATLEIEIGVKSRSMQDAAHLTLRSSEDYPKRVTFQWRVSPRYAQQRKLRACGRSKSKRERERPEAGAIPLETDPKSVRQSR